MAALVSGQGRPRASTLAPTSPTRLRSRGHILRLQVRPPARPPALWSGLCMMVAGSSLHKDLTRVTPGRQQGD